MDVETITKLLDAGYTKAEIDAMGKDEQPKDEQPKDEKPKDEQPKDEQPKDEKGHEVDYEAAIKSLNETVKTLSDTVKAMQDKNIDTASGGEKPKDEIKEVINSFINTL